MTETEWLACEDLVPMLEFLRGKVSDRKLRLFAVACCRRIWQLLENESSQQTVQTAEQYADRMVGQEQLETVRTAADTARRQAGLDARLQDMGQPGNYWKMWMARATVMTAAVNAYEAAEQTARSVTETIHDLHADNTPHLEEVAKARTKIKRRSGRTELKELSVLLREIFGNRFRPVIVDPSWQIANVVAIAQAIYDERAFDRLPILADALEDAGCTSANVLDHCRGGGEHVRGCWAVDLLLGKK